ncbi:MAG: hypothetical protein GY788_30610 [bacterium]|nr:hypothetical protein [bacterium]
MKYPDSVIAYATRLEMTGFASTFTLGWPEPKGSRYTVSYKNGIAGSGLTNRCQMFDAITAGYPYYFYGDACLLYPEGGS